ncbi:MAG: flagellar export chaperone FlgN [Magnetospirillum gryphiswaldense]|nr:flagellar export chaperone FlgN [Magnetospirillum gryphiswaldense]
MLPFVPQPVATVRPARQTAEALLDTVSELSELIAEENRALAAGYPAGLDSSTERKTVLAAEYAELWEDLGAEGAAMLAQDPEFSRVLMAAVVSLRSATQENATRLEAALSASRRRVEAVLEALRADGSSSRPYGAKGDIPLDLKLSALGTNYHA